MAIKGDVTGLDELIFKGEPMIPLVDDYSGYRRSGVVRSSMDGGLTRQRKKTYNNPLVYSVSFYLDTPQHQDYFAMFALRNEGKKFICHLRGSRPIVEPFVVQVISDWEEVLATAVDGRYQMEMEIIDVRDTCLDDFLFPMYQCAGEDLYDILDGIIDIAERVPEA